MDASSPPPHVYGPIRRNAMTGKFAWLLVLLLLLSARFVPAEPSAVDGQPDLAKVDWHQVSAPSGRYLLIRGTKGACAVRFTEYHRGNDAKPPTLFSSGEESRSAQYQWFYQSEGTGRFTTQNATHGTGTVSDGPCQGIGRLCFQSGNPYFKCGPIRVLWLPSSSLSFSENATCKTAEYELSATPWSDISAVDITDGRLRWFKCDENRESFRIPMDDLLKPKGTE